MPICAGSCANEARLAYIVGDAKSPAALRDASDQFFEWIKPEPEAEKPIAKPEPARPRSASRDISTTSKADHRLRLEAAHGMERRAATLAKDK